MWEPVVVAKQHSEKTSATLSANHATSTPLHPRDDCQWTFTPGLINKKQKNLDQKYQRKAKEA